MEFVNPASRMSGRKQACYNCRQRKKKCDGKVPACSLCARGGNVCLYGNPASAPPPGASPNSLPWMPLYPSSSPSIRSNSTISTSVSQRHYPPTPNSSAAQFPVDGMPSLAAPPFDDVHSTGAIKSPAAPLLSTSGAEHSSMIADYDPLDPMDGLNFGFDDLQGWLTPLAEVSTSGLTPSHPPSQGGAIGTSNAQSPSQERFAVFLTAFWDYCHVLLPCLHQARLRMRVASSYEAFQTSPLFWVIAGCGAWHQGEHAEAQQLEKWLHQANILIDDHIKVVRNPIDTLQALVYTIHHAYVTASMAEMWVLLGKACRFVTLLGWNHLDGGMAPSPYSPKASSDEQKEERRRVVWILFLLDRAMSCMTPWSLALDDRQFLVNYPMTESHFQEAKFAAARAEAFSMNLSTLVSPDLPRTGAWSKPMSIIFRGYALLGRILTYHNLVHRDGYPQLIAAEFSDLEDVLTRFHLVIDGSPTELPEQPLQDRYVEVGFCILILTCTILLYHPTVDVPRTDKLAGDRDTATSFRRCISAARKIMERIQEEAINSMETLINPLLLPSYFLVCRFLTISWHESSNARDRNSIDTVLMLIDRIGNIYGPLALKYRKSISADLKRDAAAMRKLRRGTGSYLSEECWS